MIGVIGRMERKRTSTWKRLLHNHGLRFLEWLNQGDYQLNAFQKLAEDLEKYLVHHILTDKVKCEKFASKLTDVLTRCDENIYDKCLVAEAYAFVHLLERYRRFWAVFIEMTTKQVLPMSDEGVDVLDVGTGPAPALYAVADFYDAFRKYAEIMQHQDLIIPPPNLGSVEASRKMVHLFHILSEIGSRSGGPFSSSFTEFDNLDLRNERQRRKYHRIDQISNEDDTSWDFAEWWVNQNEPWWHEVFRYNLCIFSNFLTQLDQVSKLREELRAVFRAIRLGGVVIIVGGVGADYPKIYQIVEDIAAEMDVQRMQSIAEELPCNYKDNYAIRIKESYNRIWDLLASYCSDINSVKASLSEARWLWDPDTPLSRPKRFGVRVFRKGRF